MPYSQFSLRNLVEQFNLTLEETTRLFPDINPITPTELLSMTLQESLPLATAINSEKARSELIITPILLEIKRKMNHQIGLFSGNDFTVDSNLGLNGSPDFLITRSREQYYISAPVMTIVEAKNENINLGLGQCGSEMLAAQIFNGRENNSVTTVYGCVTTGVLWKFLQLDDQTLYIDPVEISIEPIERLLGIFIQILS
ncbi:MAG TPA: hypothetical protein DEG17_12410 [Cyanobacteria bacterium UBA11149]|nr:hypothetical protein [Cyanobacteria bacterium UBA11367]HBE59997.1 hypothetical protein [Cyanobacteria bacterium UBA11366]HBK63951.1 hypothetical protein [Cyanobacteria bacterium UBA11166]HBR75253.1 hypothetical protein [Cyanobacteria bacterium UBA11159]HBS70505.1 hypothetical protein [Cyanobacteria bacterium UBA11153]HBW89648.1 hypothetical protein [Cyanobacteria bacterium UBA11149]HCA96817.1 hypothetical protein [Cyanobacteria bacterium UBA9226]